MQEGKGKQSPSRLHKIVHLVLFALLIGFEFLFTFALIVPVPVKACTRCPKHPVAIQPADFSLTNALRWWVHGAYMPEISYTGIHRYLPSTSEPGLSSASPDRVIPSRQIETPSFAQCMAMYTKTFLRTHSFHPQHSEKLLMARLQSVLLPCLLWHVNSHHHVVPCIRP